MIIPSIISKMKNQRGVTLIEVLLMVSIIAIITPSLTTAIRHTMLVPDEVSAELSASQAVSNATDWIITDSSHYESFGAVVPDTAYYDTGYGVFYQCQEDDNRAVHYYWNKQNRQLMRRCLDPETGTDETNIVASGIEHYEDVYFNYNEPGGYLDIDLKVTYDNNGKPVIKENSFRVSLLPRSDGWGYRIPITLTNGGATVLEDLQMPITLGADFDFSHVANAQGGDIRFRNENSGQDLPYWIHTWSWQDNPTVHGYQLPITISDVPELENQQIKVRITDPVILSHIASDASDVRFYIDQPEIPYQNDGLGYRIHKINPDELWLWVDVPYIPDGGMTIYMYYGNPFTNATTPCENGDTSEPIITFGLETDDVAVHAAKIWVRVDTIPVGQSIIYMYFGSATSESQSSVPDTFDFVTFNDSFDDSSLVDNDDSENVIPSMGEVALNPNGIAIVSEDFEDEYWRNNWTRSSTDWDRSSSYVHQGSYAAHADNCDSMSNYLKLNDGLADLSGAASATVSFWFYTDDAYDSNDYFDMDIYYSGSWHDEFVHYGEGSWHAREWIYHEQMLPTEALQSDFTVRFSDGSDNGYEDLYIDEFRINKSVSAGTLRSIEIPSSSNSRFAVGTLLSWNDEEPEGTDIKYCIEYSNDGGNGWQLVPDDMLPGNSTGYDVSPIDVSSLNPDHGQIRLMATISSADGMDSPKIYDWTITYYERKHAGIEKQETHIETFTVNAAIAESSRTLYTPYEFSSLRQLGLDVLNKLLERDRSTLFTSRNPQHMFQFNIDVPVDDIQQLKVKWAGGAGLIPTFGGLKIWNDSSDRWDDLGRVWIWGLGSTSQTTRSITNDISDYIDDEGYLYVMVTNKRQLGIDRLYSDYAGVDVIYADTHTGLSSYAGAETTQEESK